MLEQNFLQDEGTKSSVGPLEVIDPFVLTLPSSSTVFVERPRLWVETMTGFQTHCMAAWMLLTQIIAPICSFWEPHFEGRGKAQCTWASVYGLVMLVALPAAGFGYVVVVKCHATGGFIAEQRLTLALLLVAVAQVIQIIPTDGSGINPFECRDSWSFPKVAETYNEHCRDEAPKGYEEVCLVGDPHSKRYAGPEVCNLTTTEANVSFFDACGPTPMYEYNASAEILVGGRQVPCTEKFRPHLAWYVYHMSPDFDSSDDIHTTPCCVLRHSSVLSNSSATVGIEWCPKTCGMCAKSSERLLFLGFLWDALDNLVIIIEYSWLHLFMIDPTAVKGGWHIGASAGVLSPTLFLFYATALVVSVRFDLNVYNFANYVVALIYMRVLFTANAKLKKMSFLRTRSRQLLFWAAMFPVAVGRFAIGAFTAIGFDEDIVGSDSFTVYHSNKFNLFASLLRTPLLALTLAALTLPATFAGRKEPVDFFIYI